MNYVFLAAFGVGLLLGVRIMFFGAERTRHPDGALPLRRWEPAIVGFLIASGIAGYVFQSRAVYGRLAGSVGAILIGLVAAVLVMRIAIATARIRPEHDPDDPRYVLQGRVALVTRAIPANGTGEICFEEAAGTRNVPARDIASSAVAVGEEVCIERVESGVAFVERWELVERRL